MSFLKVFSVAAVAFAVAASEVSGEVSAESYGVVPASTRLLTTPSRHQQGTRFATRRPFYSGGGYFLLNPESIFQQQQERNQQRQQFEQQQQEQLQQQWKQRVQEQIERNQQHQQQQQRPGVFRLQPGPRPAPAQPVQPAQPVIQPVAQPAAAPPRTRDSNTVNLLEIASQLQNGRQQEQPQQRRPPFGFVPKFSPSLLPLGPAPFTPATPRGQPLQPAAPPSPEFSVTISDRRNADPEDEGRGRTFSPRMQPVPLPPPAIRMPDFIEGYDIPPGFKVYDAVPLE